MELHDYVNTRIYSGQDYRASCNGIVILNQICFNVPSAAILSGVISIYIVKYRVNKPNAVFIISVIPCRFAHYRHEVRFMESIWSKTVKIEERPPLTSDITVEAAVIGGGLAGILTALFLKEQGIQAVVLESDRIGSGQTKNTTAKITAQHDLIYDGLINTAGLRKAKQYASANMQAINEYRRIITENNIDCDFLECPAYLYSTENAEILKRETKAALRVGIDAEFTTETELPFPVKGAVRFSGQAIFNPLRFLKAAAQDLTVYEQTKALSVDKNLIITENGKVRAKYIVFATHFPFVNVPGYYFMRLYQSRSYVLALENAAEMDGAYLGVDADGFSFRNYKGLTLLGGGGHRTGENSAGGKYELLRRKASELWPQCTEAAHWSAQDCMTSDGVPYIGRFSRSRPDWYVCTGFGKWGMTSSMVAAMLISSKIAGQKYPYASAFSPQRQITPPAAKSVLKNGLKAAKSLGKQLLQLPVQYTDELPCGHGGVVEFEGGKFGVYKDDEGNCFVVDTRCPHMGCQLEWNPDELSWDCPCHGSRFDYMGRLIDNPAQEDIG